MKIEFDPNSINNNDAAHLVILLDRYKSVFVKYGESLYPIAGVSVAKDGIVIDLFEERCTNAPWL